VTTALAIFAAFLAGFGGCRILHLLAFRSMAWRLRVLPLVTTAILSAQQNFGVGHAIVHRFLETYWDEVIMAGGSGQEIYDRERDYYEQLSPDARVFFNVVAPQLGACATLYGAESVRRALASLSTHWIRTQAAAQAASKQPSVLDAVMRRVFRG
jgi:hypothetical protein